MVNLVCVCVCVFLHILVSHTLLEEFALMLRLLLIHSAIVLCLTSWEQSTLNATLRRSPPQAMYDRECLLFMPSMTTEHTHTHTSPVGCKLNLSRPSRLWIPTFFPSWLTSYLSAYLAVFSARLVIKLFCIYCHLKTHILFLCLCGGFIPLVFVFIHLTHHYYVGDTTVTFFKRVIAFGLNCFWLNSIKTKIYTCNTMLPQLFLF